MTLRVLYVIVFVKTQWLVVTSGCETGFVDYIEMVKLCMLFLDSDNMHINMYICFCCMNLGLQESFKSKRPDQTFCPTSRNHLRKM